MFDFRFNWHGKFRNETLSRFVVSPLFDQAGELLSGAARLWIGRYGAGRLRADELRQYANQLFESGHHWRQCALGWSDSPFAPLLKGEGTVGGLLSERAFRWRVRHGDETETAKHPAAARTLVETAARLLELAIPGVRTTGRYMRGQEADKWEDFLEKLGEHPAAVPPEPPLPQSCLEPLLLRSLSRAGEGLCCQMRYIILTDKSSAKGQQERTSEKWSELEKFFTAKSAALYEAFATEAARGAEETAAILSVKDACQPDCLWVDHYASWVELNRAGAIIRAWVNTLWKDAGGPLADESLAKFLEASPAGLLPEATDRKSKK